MYEIVSWVTWKCTIQWGFTKGKATTGALLTAVDSWHRHLEAGLNICTVFFDLKKAFDSVSHTVLLKKLSDSGLCPYLLKWIYNYLAISPPTVNHLAAQRWSLVFLRDLSRPLLFQVYVNYI